MSDDNPEPEPTRHGPPDADGPSPSRPTLPARVATDRVPAVLLRGQAWLHRWLSNESRVLMGVVIVAVAVVGAIAMSSLRIVQVIFEELDAFVVVTLFLVNWLGNGGVLVPIPGARFIGLLMVFQQAVVLPSLEVLLVAGAAMGMGQLSYYIAGARTAQSYAEGDEAGASKIAADSGMLDDDAVDFAPGAELDADIVTALADIGASPSVATGGDGDEAGATSPGVQAASPDASASQHGWRSRFSTSLKRAQDRARPVLERRGAWGMFLMCFAPTPLGTAAAYVGGLMEFGFRRYLISSFAAKFLLTGVIIVLALTFSETAQAVALPPIELPQIDWPDFDLHLFDLPERLPGDTPAASPGASPGAGPSGGPSA